MSHNNLFDLEILVREELARSLSNVDRLTARTRVGHRAFDDALRKSGLRSLVVGERIDLSKDPNAVVVGLATYSDDEMQMLNNTWQYLLRRGAFVFDTDSFLSFDQLAYSIPGISPFTQTPILCEYKDNFLVHIFEGKKALGALMAAASCI